MSLARDKKEPDLWRSVIYPNGRKKDPRTGKPSNDKLRSTFIGSEVEARQWYQQLLKSVTKVKAPIVAPTIDQAYSKFIEYYKHTVKVSPRTLTDFILTYERHLKPFFGQFRPNMLTPGLIESYKAKRQADKYLPGKRGQKPADDTPEEATKRIPISSRTVQKEITYLKAYIRYMTDSEYNLAEPLPFKIRNYKASQTEAPPKVIPSRREMILLIRACRGKNDRKYRALLAIAYYSGLRRAELFALNAASIDRHQGYLIIKGKGGKIRTVPIVTRLKPYIRNLPHKGRIFTSATTGEEYDNVDRLLARTCEAVGMPTISMHTFRHAFAVHALMRGVSLRTLQMVMGHSSIKTTERYLRLVPTDLAKDLDKVPRKLTQRARCIAPKIKPKSTSNIIYLQDRRSSF